MEDMLWDGKSGLTEAVVTGPGQAILFYGRQSPGEGLNLGEVCDVMFMLSGAMSWVGKQAQLNASGLILWEDWQLIAQAITKWCAEARGLGCPHSHPPAFPLFRFCHQDKPLQEERLQGTDKCMQELRHTHWTLHHNQGQVPQCGWDHSQMWWDPWVAPTPSPSPSLDHEFESDRSSVSTSSSVSWRSHRSGGSRHMHCGWHHKELGGHMKINLPVFKDKDKKDTITYQSWHWDLTVYHHARCWDCTLLHYIICSVQEYPREFVRSLGTDATLDGVLSILDEHYNNVKALDALNQELFQL